MHRWTTKNLDPAPDSGQLDTRRAHGMANCVVQARRRIWQGHRTAAIHNKFLSDGIIAFGVIDPLIAWIVFCFVSCCIRHAGPPFFPPLFFPDQLLRLYVEICTNGGLRAKPIHQGTSHQNCHQPRQPQGSGQICSKPTRHATRAWPHNRITHTDTIRIMMSTTLEATPKLRRPG